MIFRCPRCGRRSLLDGLCQECAKGRRYVTMVPTADGPAMLLSDVSVLDVPRLTVPGFPRVEDSLHGGFVRGAAMLLHGGPGVGKSTLALQLCSRIGRLVRPLYVTTEQMLAHIKMAGVRLGMNMAGVYALASEQFDDVVACVEGVHPAFVVIDALQNLTLRAPYDGNRMVAVCTGLVRMARHYDCAVVIVCHETKDETFAGPRTLEHLVDGMIVMAGDLPEGQTPTGIKWRVYGKYRFGPVPRTVYLDRHAEGDFYERESACPGSVDRHTDSRAAPEAS